MNNYAYILHFGSGIPQNICFKYSVSPILKNLINKLAIEKGNTNAMNNYVQMF